MLGPLAPVPDEFAWGSTSIAQATGLVNAGMITQTPAPRTRTPTTFRCSDLSGLGLSPCQAIRAATQERPVTVGNPEGRALAGTHGDGVLDAGVNANVASWLGSDAVGAGFRGGSWLFGDGHLRVSDRHDAEYTDADRDDFQGWRCARSAP